MITIRLRSLMWFATGVAMTVLVAGFFVARFADADPGEDESTFVPITPCRLFDTRPAPDTVGQRSSPIGATDTHTQEVHGTNGDCVIPDTATAVALNVTAINATARSFLTVFPADRDRPLAASLNYTAGAPPTPNKVDVRLAADGRLDFYNESGSVNLAVDVSGYYTNAGIQDLQAQIDALETRLDSPERRAVVYGATALAVVGQDRETRRINGCTSPDVSVEAFVPLALPVGATIVEVRVDVFDNFGEQIEIALVEEVPRPSTSGPIGLDREDVVRAEVGTDEFGRFTHVLTPDAPAVVEGGGTAFAIEFFPIDNAQHAFCSATVTFDMP